MSATGHSVYSALFIPILGQLLKDLRQLCEENKKETVTAEGGRVHTLPPTHCFSCAFSTTGEVQSVPPGKFVMEQAMHGVGLNPRSLIQSCQVKGVPPHTEYIAQAHCLA